MQLSPQQRAVLEAAPEGKNLIVRSGAGTGKTTLAGALCSVLEDPLVTSFARLQVDDFNKRFPQHTAQGLNSLGHRAWLKQTGKRMGVEKRKLWLILNADRGLKAVYNEYPDLIELVKLAKSRGIVPPGAMGTPIGCTPDTEDSWDTLRAEYDLDAPTDAAREILRRDIEQGWRGIIDFDDQLYLTAIYRAPLPRHKNGVIDEVQDLTPVQREMVGLMFDQITGVGDPWQAIYGFRGADRHSYENFAARFQCTEFPLSVTFRCPKAVVREANAIVEDYHADESAPEGLVQHHQGIPTLGQNSVVLCRNNAPLVRLFFTLLKNGQHASLKGRDMLGKITATLRKQCRPEDTPHDIDKKLTLILHGLPEKKRPAYTDMIDSIMAVGAGISNPTAKSIIQSLERMSGEAPITLSTIHRAKGLEWRQVYFLNRGLIPSPYARTADELAQEQNLAYVGITRSLSELHYIEE